MRRAASLSRGTAAGKRPALFDALPLLKTARDVTVISVREFEYRTRVEDDQERDVCATLSRHGVRTDWVSKEPLDEGTGATILAEAGRHAADLVVMGGYSHARWRELVLGGVTRHVLRHMRTPVLLSH